MDRQCFVCGRPVSRPSNLGRYPRFCSAECRAEAKRLKAAAKARAAYEAEYNREREVFRARYLEPARDLADDWHEAIVTRDVEYRMKVIRPGD